MEAAVGVVTPFVVDVVIPFVVDVVIPFVVNVVRPLIPVIATPLIPVITPAADTTVLVVAAVGTEEMEEAAAPRGPTTEASETVSGAEFTLDLVREE